MNRKPAILFAEGFGVRLMGLMGKTKWPAKHQGIYFPRCGSVHTFFTFLRPDLLFLDKTNKILRVYPSAKPWLIFVGPAHTFGCLEIPQGEAQLKGLKEGNVVAWLCK